jgi:hypothetical protein
VTIVSLADWLANGWIVAHEPTREEILDLFAVIDRDLADAAIPRLSADARLNIGYNGALQLATVAWPQQATGPDVTEPMSGPFSRCATPSGSAQRR